MNPIISIVIPTFNRGSAIEATIESVLAQTLDPEQVEVLIVDDGSTDNTWKLLQTHYDEHPRIQLFRIPNGGVARARNFGLERARGEFIAFLDHDDLWLPHNLKWLLETLRACPSCAVAFARWRNVDEHGQTMTPSHLITGNPNGLPQPGRAYDWICRMPCQIVSMSAALIRIENLRSVEGFDPATTPADDWDLWMRLGERFDFVQVPHEIETVLYVHHVRQQSSQFWLMRRGTVAAIRKQKRQVLKHPARALFLWGFEAYFSTAMLYRRAKSAAVEEDFGRAWRLFGLAAGRAPIVLFSKQWVFLARRLVAKDSRPY